MKRDEFEKAMKADSESPLCYFGDNLANEFFMVNGEYLVLCNHCANIIRVSKEKNGDR